MNTISVVKEAQYLFADMLKYSVRVVELNANHICALVKSGKTTWGELGFIREDVDKRLWQAKVRAAKGHYADMSEPLCSVSTVECLAGSIHALVKSGKIPWKELGFTAKDVAEQLEQAKARAQVDA
jgi:hypothetical protein